MAEVAPDAGSPLHLRIFVASPGAVADERAQALKLLDELAYQPLLRGYVTVETVAWDKPGAGAPMLATLTPQEAIARGLPLPSECHVVIVIFWSRMGTLLPAEYLKPDGSRYRSGTEWEYEDAMRGARELGQPKVLVYRRTEPPTIGLNQPDAADRVDQWKQVEQFFQSFRNADGSLRGGYNPYTAPEDFRRQLEQHLHRIIREVLESRQVTRSAGIPLWKGSPFPGLRAFTADDAAIFFGRGRETDALVRILAGPASRFLAVFGASGWGKSSLVSAGLMPRLRANAIEGSRDWVWVRFTPAELGNDPFLALAARLAPLAARLGWETRDLTERLRADTPALDALAAGLIADRPAWTELGLFVDQFEELFTSVAPHDREPFVRLLALASESPRLRVVATLRADFYERCLELPQLAQLLAAGHYPLSAPGTAALLDIVTRPASRAGLTFEEGLVDRLLADTGAEPGALPLLAFALSELHEAREADGRLTHAAYERFDGVQGAIARRAEETFGRLETTVQAALGVVFQELVEVDEEGRVARRRAPVDRVTASPAAATLVDALTRARLLVQGSGERGEPLVEVAHEKLLSAWPRLSEWLGSMRADLRLLRQVKLDAAEWDRQSRLPEFLWNDKRLGPAYEMLERLKPELGPTERRFLRLVDASELIDELNDPATVHQRRAYIGTKLAEADRRPGVGLRADGLPDFVWCHVPAGRPVAGRPMILAFEIAKYPVTYIQYRTFLEADDGYRDVEWWHGLGLGDRDPKPGEQYRRLDNHPADNVSWYDAAAFCRWLSARVGEQIRLPKESEWQRAAGGSVGNGYPWGGEWDSGRANTEESGLGHTTAVGMYPHGASPVGALDMSGNVWEWCDDYYHGGQLGGPRVVRGGSATYARETARVTYRDRDLPELRTRTHGFRVARALKR